MTLLEVKNLAAGYGSKQVLKGVSFEVEPHCLMGILGANGSGKTTLLKSLCGITPSTGEISLMERNARKLSARELAKRCSYIPQRTGISIDLPVLDVVLMGFNPHLGLLEYPGADMKAAAADALRRVGLADRADSNFQTLSEGQKQLCILARTMLLETGVLLMDEPESALDFSGRYKILSLVRQWLAEREGAALVTLHDPQLALNTCDQLLLIRDGRAWATLCPQTDPIAETEEKISAIFGSLSIHRCTRRDGKTQFVMLKED